jgi:dolichol-phosphate mannosyltransferase
MSSVKLISVIVPTHNEIANVEPLYRRLRAVFSGLPAYEFELIFCDDSTDATPIAVARLHEVDSRVKLIRLSRRFGQSAAITAGIDQCSGNAAILMDADLQDPPEIIPRLIELWEAGNEVVYVERPSRSTYAAYEFFAGVYYHILRRLSAVEIPRNAGEFRLVDGKVLTFLRTLKEHTRFLRGLTVWPGLRQVAVKIDRPPRMHGRTNYGFTRSFLAALDGMVSFSVVPLRLAAIFGCVVAVLSLLAGATYGVLKIFYSSVFGVGWTSLMVSIFFLGGVQLMFLGILGEYVGRIFMEVQQRPLYWVDYQIGFPSRFPPPSGPPGEAKP